jgi:hypothetical protein
VNYLNSFTYANASQATEFIIWQYKEALRMSEPVETQTYPTNDYVEKQRLGILTRVKPSPRESYRYGTVTRVKKLKPTKRSGI